ncbi:MAG: ABC transporter substrate-binding protein [Actinomycetota bacterium]
MAEHPAGGPTTDDVQIRTFLIADVRGYTIFTNQRGDEAAAKLAAKFADVAKETIAARGGSVIELRGDEALAVFSSPRQAIRAALDLQARFVEETLADPSFPLPVGIGLDAGEAVAVAGGFRGGALNLAARLCGQAGPGEVLASAEAVHLARKIDGVTYVDRGTVHLKGLEDPVRVIKVIPEGDDPADLLKPVAQPIPSKTPSRQRGGRRAALIAAIAAALVAAIAVPVLRHDQRVEPLAGNGIQLLDAASQAITGTLSIHGSPGGIASGAGSIWLTDTQAGSLLKVDPYTHAVVDTIPIGGGAGGVAFGAGSVWVVASDAGQVDRVDPTGRVVARIGVGNGPSAVAASDDAVWVANFSDDSVTRIDPSTSTVVGTAVPVGDGPTAIAADASGAWVTSINDGFLTHVEASGHSTTSVRVGNGPEGVATTATGVWVTNSLDGTLSEIDPGAMAIATTIPVGDGPTGITYGNGSLWVANRYGGSIAKVDPRTAHPSPITVAGEPVASILAGNVLWVATQASPTAHLGGTLRFASQEGFDSIDPATAYGSWPILSMTNDGLVAFQRVGGPQGAAIVPDLASSIPRPSNGGKAYTFQLRPGIRYSDDTLVLADDFRLALERMFAQGGDSAQYFKRLVGAQACKADPATCDLSDGVVTNDAAATVTFRLTKPDPELLYALALPAAFAVPQGTPRSPITTTPIPATGPYRITSYELGKDGSIQLERNPRFREWSRAAKPDGYVDSIDWAFGMSQDAQIAALEGGHLDYAADVPPSRVHELRVRYPSQVFEQSAGATLGFAFDVRTPPLNDARVRQAFQFAVDRARMVVVGAALYPLSITCQALPPDFPSYRPYCPYTSDPSSKGAWSGPDMREARRLVAASGTRGASISIMAPEPQTAAAREMSRALSKLGYRPSLHISPLGGYFDALYAPTNRVQIRFVGWGADFPAPSGFLPPLFSCGSVPFNVSHFCEPVVERAMRRALALQVSDPAAANAAWADVDRMITDRSPWLAYANLQDVYLVSARVGNVQINPQWKLLLDQLWVN